MKLAVTNVFVDDQAAALDFYTEILGFVKKAETPVGQHLWITVVSPEQPDAVELLLEPADHPAASAYRRALVADGIPSAQFAVEDVHSEYQRLRRLGSRSHRNPPKLGR